MNKGGQNRHKEKKAPETEHCLGCHAFNPQWIEITGASALQLQNRDSARLGIPVLLKGLQTLLCGKA